MRPPLVVRDPDLTQYENRYILFTWWDNLPEHERTPALIESLVLAGIDVKHLTLDRRQMTTTEPV